MKRLLLVLGLVALVSLTASAKKTPSTSYNFQFLSSTGDPFCDGMLLYNYGNPQNLVDGTHFDILCNGYNLAVNGFKASIPSAYQYGGSGNTLIVADESVSYSMCNTPSSGSTGSNVTCLASSGTYPTDVYLINPTTHTWILWLSGGGAGEYVVNYGTFDPVVGPLESAKPSQLPSSQRPRSSFQR